MLASKIVFLGSYARLIARDEQACVTPTSTASQVSVQAANNPSIQLEILRAPWLSWQGFQSPQRLHSQWVCGLQRSHTKRPHQCKAIFSQTYLCDTCKEWVYVYINICILYCATSIFTHVDFSFVWGFHMRGKEKCYSRPTWCFHNFDEYGSHRNEIPNYVQVSMTLWRCAVSGIRVVPEDCLGKPCLLWLLEHSTSLVVPMAHVLFVALPATFFLTSSYRCF